MSVFLHKKKITIEETKQQNKFVKVKGFFLAQSSFLNTHPQKFFFSIYCNFVPFFFGSIIFPAIYVYEFREFVLYNLVSQGMVFPSHLNHPPTIFRVVSFRCQYLPYFFFSPKKRRNMEVFF